MTDLFEAFLKERRYLKKVTPRTLDYYRKGFFGSGFAALGGSPKGIEKRFLIALRERGVSAITCNSYARGLNAFLKWAHEEGHLPELIRIPLQREEKRIIVTLTDAHLRILLTFKPRSRADWRVFTLASLLIDTGIRIDEALGLPLSSIEMDNLLLKVKGKGRKERIVPFSLQMRKVLFQWLKQRHDPLRSDRLFPTRTGNRITQRNAARAHYEFLQRLGIPQCGFHRRVTRLRRPTCEKVATSCGSLVCTGIRSSPRRCDICTFRLRTSQPHTNRYQF